MRGTEQSGQAGQSTDARTHNHAFERIGVDDLVGRREGVVEFVVESVILTTVGLLQSRDTQYGRDGDDPLDGLKELCEVRSLWDYLRSRQDGEALFRRVRVVGAGTFAAFAVLMSTFN